MLSKNNINHDNIIAHARDVTITNTNTRAVAVTCIASLYIEMLQLKIIDPRTFTATNNDNNDAG